MSPELQERLYKDYPKIFIQKDQPMSLTSMCWGIDTGDGWYNIINQLCRQIQWHIDKNLKKDEDPETIQVQATQVKEKYGTLRFYYLGGNEYINGLVSMAESISGVTCEICGSPGASTGGGWIRTICPTCEKKEKAEWERKNAISIDME